MIRKAVIPAAGFGTRLLPATKSQPKEMIPVVDKPVIQYVVEEAVNSGITDILMVIGKGKRAIEEHFDRNVELEARLEEKNKTQLLEEIRKISDMANIHFVWQKEQNGLGDAVSYAETFVGDEPFAVLLGDTILDTEIPTTKQLMTAYDKYKASVIALEEVDPAIVHRYGVIDGEQVDDHTWKAKAWVEKPVQGTEPSNLVISGRYVFTPAIFDRLKSITRGVNDEIQLTDAMRSLLQSEEMYGSVIKGTRYDVGNKLDFIKTNLLLGLKDKNIGGELRAWLKSIDFDQK